MKDYKRLFEKVKGIKILNVGCGYTKVPIAGVHEIRLDIDPKVRPDIVLDLHRLTELPKQSCDGVWCSHVLEHFCEHELPIILNGIRHVLKKDGVFFAMVPDLNALFGEMRQRSLSLNDVIYVSGMGPVRPRDMLYGFQPQVASGNSFYCHKTGFDSKALTECLVTAGFKKIFTGEANLEIQAVACMNQPPKWVQPFIRAGKRI